MPSLTQFRRIPAAIAALALVGSLAFTATAQADEPDLSAVEQIPAVVVPLPEIDPAAESTENESSESNAEGESTEADANAEAEAESSEEPAADDAANFELASLSEPALLAAPAVEPLTCSPVTAITSLGALDLSSNSTDGSSTTVLETGGLHVTTAASGNRKAAGYVSGVGWQPLDSVTDFVLQWTGSAAKPGGQLPVDLDGDNTPDGILVIEPINGGIQWLSVPGGGTWISKLGAPHAAGGGGYPNQGTFAEWSAAYPNAQWTSPGYSLGSGLTGDGVIGSLTVVGSSNCAYTFALPPVTPVACVATGGWAASDVNDLPAQVTAGGLVFTGQTKSVNYYQRVSQGNAQGITGMSYTVSNASGPYGVQVKVEIFREGTTGYTTLSSKVPAGTTGVINPLAWPWYSSRTLTGPGSMSQPLPWADLIALFPNNVLLSAPSLHMQSSGAGSSGTVTAISSSCGSTTFPQTVAPSTCVAAAGWAASDPNDVSAQLTANGLVFSGQTKSVNYYQRPATVSNAQGITGMTYTIAPGATGYGVQLKVELNPRANLGGGTLVTYATLSTIQVPAVTPLSGTIDAQNSLWYTNKITSGPGSMASPLPWNQIIALMPNNTLISTPSLHLQTGASAADYAVVTSVSSSCGSSSFVTPPVTMTECTSSPVASGTMPSSWSFKPAALTGARYVAGGMELDATVGTGSSWAIATLPAGTHLSDLGDLTTTLASSSGANWGGLIFEGGDLTSQLHYDTNGRFWTLQSGIFPAVRAGYYQSFDIVAGADQVGTFTASSDPLISSIKIYVNEGQKIVVSAQNYLCATQPFGLTPPVVTPPVVTPPATGGTGGTPSATTGAAGPATPAATTPTATPTPTPTAPATNDDTAVADQLPTEAFDAQPTVGDAPWWPWVLGVAMLLLLALFWFLLFRRRRNSEN